MEAELGDRVGERWVAQPQGNHSSPWRGLLRPLVGLQVPSPRIPDSQGTQHPLSPSIRLKAHRWLWPHVLLAGKWRLWWREGHSGRATLTPHPPA